MKSRVEISYSNGKAFVTLIYSAVACVYPTKMKKKHVCRFSGFNMRCAMCRIDIRVQDNV